MTDEYDRFRGNPFSDEVTSIRTRRRIVLPRQKKRLPPHKRKLAREMCEAARQFLIDRDRAPMIAVGLFPPEE